MLFYPFNFSTSPKTITVINGRITAENVLFFSENRNLFFVLDVIYSSYFKQFALFYPHCFLSKITSLILKLRLIDETAILKETKFIYHHKKNILENIIQISRKHLESKWLCSSTTFLFNG